MQRDIRKTLDRLIPRLQPKLKRLSKTQQNRFFVRLESLFPSLFETLLKIYGERFDFFYHLEQILTTAAQYYALRSEDLRQVDIEREANPNWFQSEQIIGGVCYVDLFADDFAGIRAKIPYFKELGLSYLHLMPLFKSPETNSDGGYAISSFRETNPKLGSMPELTELAQEFRENGINLVLDFVFNHTSDEHEWAKKALAGDADFQDFYLMFPDRTLPDQYEKMLREIFPEAAPGSFSYRPEIDKWVWTTFYPFQFDLNYRNPEVFNAILGEMLFLANIGVDVLRMDAVAFIWKEMGTVCENLPPAHWILQAYNALVRLVAPGMVFKSEAIVHPDEVAKYFGEDEMAGYECPISYNPTLMAILWESLATRKVELLRHSMQKRFELPANCAWVNYLRVHDDIGWSFADEDASELGISGFYHRLFLNQFFTGNFEGSFARGLRFNYNPITQDARICGMLASLAGMESALESADPNLIHLATQRILMLYSIILSIGGIPLIYLGDEIATLNNYSFRDDPEKAQDERWVHRPQLNPAHLERRHSADNIEGKIFGGLTRLIQLRKSHPIFGDSPTRIIDSQNPHVFSFMRWQDGTGLLGLFSFSEFPQSVDLSHFRVHGAKPHMQDMLTGEKIILNGRYELQPYQFLWLMD